MNRNYEETDSRLDASQPHPYEEPKVDYSDTDAQRNYILTGLQDMSDACEDGNHNDCHHTLHDLCKCPCHQAATTEPEPVVEQTDTEVSVSTPQTSAKYIELMTADWTEPDEFDNGDSIRTPEEQAELEADAALAEIEAEQAEEAWIASYIEEEKKQRGGARPGAGRKPDPSRFDERSYQAGYKAGLRAAKKD